MDDNFNTIAGWTLGAAIVGLGLSSISSHYFSADRPHRPHHMGYEIEGVVAEGGEDAVPIATLLAGADPAKGQQLFAKCASCHTVNAGGPNGTGPNIHGVLGKQIGQGAGGFAYSSALKEVGGSWTFEQMDAWLKSPKGFAPGTKMTFAGMGKPEERAAMILFLNSQGSNLPLPAAPPPGESAVAGDVEAEPPAGQPATEPAGQAVAPSGPANAGSAKEAGAMAQPDPRVQGGGDRAVGNVMDTKVN